VGCTNDEGVGNTNEKPPTKEEIQKQLDAIDADPNMPAQAKAMKKSMIERGGTGQKEMLDRK